MDFLEHTQVQVENTISKATPRQYVTVEPSKPIDVYTGMQLSQASNQQSFVNVENFAEVDCCENSF